MACIEADCGQLKEAVKDCCSSYTADANGRVCVCGELRRAVGQSDGIEVTILIPTADLC